MKYQLPEKLKNNIKKKNINNNKQKINIDIYKQNKKKKQFLDRPFLQTYEGHKDSVLCIKTHTKHPSLFFSGSSDGQIKFWLINRKKCTKSIKAHNSFVRDLAIDFTGSVLLSCSDDFFIKLWNINKISKNTECFYTNSPINSLTTHNLTHFFITGGKEVLLWDLNKFQPVQKLICGVSSISKIEFNPIEYNLISSCCSDRSIILFDFRLRSQINRLFLDMPSNDISWNLTNFLQFTVANEDGNLYSFDLRNLDKIFKIYKGHVMPVLCLDQSSYSRTIISGSCDNTIRLFRTDHNLCNDIFFSQRMRRVLDISFSLDGKYIISASEDGDLRLWKNFEEKNYIYKNNYEYKKNKNNQKKMNITQMKLIPDHVKNLFFIKTRACPDKIKKIFNISNKKLPEYVKFKIKVKTNK
jgi:DDB1- and CUL4-associated factor 13